MDRCPYHNVNYSQEKFIFQQYGHYKNKHLPMDLLEIPCWLLEGFLMLNHCEAVDRERNKRNNNG